MVFSGRETLEKELTSIAPMSGRDIQTIRVLCLGSSEEN